MIRARIAILAATALVAALALAPPAIPGAQAQSSIGEMLRAQRPDANAEPIEVKIGCGVIDKANCAIVVPALAAAAQAASGSGRAVNLTRLTSTGSVQSAEAVCAGIVQAAVVQSDVADLLARPAEAKGVRDPLQGACAGKFRILGQPIYPYIGFLAVRASQPDQFDKLIDSLGPNQRLRVAVGGVGSGGETTMQRILAVRQDWKRHVELRNEPASTAIQALKDGNLDAVFVMDGIESPWPEAVLAQKDQRGRPVFAFADMRPGREVTGGRGPKDGAGRPLYTRFTLASGLFRDTRVVSTPAVLIVSEAFARTPEGERAIRVLGEAVERAVPGIRSATRTPTDWDPQSNAF